MSKSMLVTMRIIKCTKDINAPSSPGGRNALGIKPLVTFETKIQFNLRETLPAYFPSVPTLQHPRRARLDSLQS